MASRLAISAGDSAAALAEMLARYPSTSVRFAIVKALGRVPGERPRAPGGGASQIGGSRYPGQAASFTESITAVGRLGAVTNAGALKSKKSSIGSAAASRAVRDGNPKRYSMKLRIDV